DSITRELRSTERMAVSNENLEQEPVEVNDSEDREGSLAKHEPSERKPSFWSSVISGTASFLTPSFLRKSDSSSVSDDVVKSKSSTPKDKRPETTEYEEDQVSLEVKTPHREQLMGTPFPIAAKQGKDSLQEQSVKRKQGVHTDDAGYIVDLENIDDGDSEEKMIAHRIKALQLKMEQIAQESRQRQDEESQLQEKIKAMDERRRKFTKQIERQNKILRMREEEEKLEKLLQQKQDEEVGRRYRLDMLYEEEEVMRKEMKEEERVLQYRSEVETYPKQYREMKHDKQKEENFGRFLGQREDEEVEPTKPVGMFYMEEPLKTKELQTEGTQSRYRFERDTYPKWDREPGLDTEIGMNYEKESFYPYKGSEESVNREEKEAFHIYDSKGEYETMREEEFRRKEKYLRELEEELNRKENEIRRKLKLDTASEQISIKQTSSSTDSSVKADIKEERKNIEDRALTKQEITHIIKPFISSFSGAEPVPQKEVCFDDWKLESNYLIKSSTYPDFVINQAIRNSLRGQARKVVNTMTENVSTEQILEKLESVFGNVASGESIVQEFYNAYQRPTESTTLWGIRLEEIYEKAREKGHVTKEQKENMLRNKFWRGLYRTDLKNATHVYFVSDKIDFETLRKKVKAEEYEMVQERRFGQKDKKVEVKSLKVEIPEEKEDTAKLNMQQQQLQKESNTQLLIDLAKDVKGMKKTIEYSNRNLRRAGYRGRPNRGRGGSYSRSTGADQNQNTSETKPPENRDTLNA
ncbi:MAG: hypothetical protein N0C90_22935, partial [Candidatus Thiodiazotropha endolucinida]|nr:hypothetical protein [Candidatus Thiodiazotropha taylori]MCW4264210.1 hypothetical protein [Candidatus Thiodiazotropha endolucinida]